jgi:Uma2 family endonuclease
MSAAPKLRYTPQEYLEIDRAAEFKSEYFAGEIVAMAGARENHNIITVNLTTELRTRLRGGPCRPFSADMRVSAGAGGLYAYPDVVVVCGERRFADERRDVLLNPTVIFEVLSPNLSPGPSPARGGESVSRATGREHLSPFPPREGGRGVRFEQYRRLESLQE